MTNDNDLIRRAALQDAGYDTVAVAASQTADPVTNADSRQRVMVKPLVWEGHSDDQRSGDYVIKPSYGQGPKRLLLARGSKLVSWHDYMDEAQRAGQDDHEARILAAIDVQPDPRDAQIAALVDAMHTISGDIQIDADGEEELSNAAHTARAALAAVKGDKQ